MKKLKFKGKIESIKEVKDLKEGKKLTKAVLREPIYDYDGDYTGEDAFYPIDFFSDVVLPRVLEDAKNGNNPITVVARLRSSEYEDQEKNHRYGLNVVAKHVET